MLCYIVICVCVWLVVCVCVCSWWCLVGLLLRHWATQNCGVSDMIFYSWQRWQIALVSTKMTSCLCHVDCNKVKFLSCGPPKRVLSLAPPNAFHWHPREHCVVSFGGHGHLINKQVTNLNCHATNVGFLFMAKLADCFGVNKKLPMHASCWLS